MELKQTSNLDIKVAEKLIRIRKSAEDRGIYFCMTFSEVKRLLSVEKCYITGVKFEEVANSPKQRTFDRLDNTKGYVNGNVIACTKEFNSIKGNITIEQVKLMVKAFKKKKIWN